MDDEALDRHLEALWRNTKPPDWIHLLPGHPWRKMMRMGPDALEELRERFNYHRPPNDAVVKAHEDVRAVCFGAAMRFVECCPEGPEQTLAIRKLEEAMFWANAAIARNHGAFAQPDPEAT